MVFLSSESNVVKQIEIFLKEIKVNIEESGKINVHLNQVFIAGYREEDYARQSFIFFVLCKVKYFLPDLVEDALLDKIISYIKTNYEYNTVVSDIEKKHIEVYTLRGLTFLRKSDPLLERNLVENSVHLVYSKPILLHLFLALEADNLKLNGKGILPRAYLSIAKESVFYSLKSEQKDENNAFQYVDIFYYNDPLELTLKEQTFKLVQIKIEEELKRVHSIYTSVLAKMFEGYTALYPSNKDKISFFFALCLERKVKKNPYLTQQFKYSSESLSEVEGTAYVCLDSYAHLILGLLNLYEKYEH